MRLPAFEKNAPRLEQGFQKRVILQRRYAVTFKKGRNSPLENHTKTTQNSPRSSPQIATFKWRH